MTYGAWKRKENPSEGLNARTSQAKCCSPRMGVRRRSISGYRTGSTATCATATGPRHIRARSAFRIRFHCTGVSPAGRPELLPALADFGGGYSARDEIGAEFCGDVHRDGGIENPLEGFGL